MSKNLWIALHERIDWRHRLDVYRVRIAMETICYWMDFDKYRDARWRPILREMLARWPAEKFEQLFYWLKFSRSQSEGRREFEKYFVESLADLRSEEAVASEYIEAVLSHYSYEDFFRNAGKRLVVSLSPSRIARLIMRSSNEKHVAMLINDAIVGARTDTSKLQDLYHLRDLFENDTSPPSEYAGSRRSYSAARAFLGWDEK